MASRSHAHGRMVERTYNLPGDQYWALYEAQGGRCALCRVATGKVRRLAVDHDHETGQVFGLCCGPCNIMLGRLGRTPDPYLRVLDYLHNPPAVAALGRRVIVPSP
jgi:Recombination endonuclease VII